MSAAEGKLPHLALAISAHCIPEVAHRGFSSTCLPGQRNTAAHVVAWSVSGKWWK
jgi:hypothetical protein